MGEFVTLANDTLITEMQLHRDYCSQFGISTEELETTEPSPICQAYSDFCISTAATGSCLDLLCALVPCGVGYAEIGKRLHTVPSIGESPYRQWIETYASDCFQEFAQWMMETLNQLGRDAGPDNTRLSRLKIDL